MPSLTLADLDQRPELAPAVLALFAAAPPGAHHLVCGLPAAMGQEPTAEILARTAGTLLALSGRQVAGAIGICPYSEDQVTLWGPATAQAAIAEFLFTSTREALHLSRFGSMRVLVDTRNREQRSFYRAHGFAAWKDDHLYECVLEARTGTGTVSRGSLAFKVRAATTRDHNAVISILTRAFPDSDHCLPSLAKREADGYRHYVLDEAGTVVAAAAVQDAGRRGWLKLIAVKPELRGRQLSRRLLEGVLASEARRGKRTMALEVLADNAPAIALYEHAGFRRKWTATVMTGPV